MRHRSAAIITARALLTAGIAFAAPDSLPAQRVAQQCVLREGQLTPVASTYRPGPADSVVIFERTADASRRVRSAVDVAPFGWLGQVRNGSIPFRDTEYFLYGNMVKTTKVSRLRYVPVGMHNGVRFYVPHPVPEGMIQLVYVRLEPCFVQPYTEVTNVRQVR